MEAAKTAAKATTLGRTGTSGRTGAVISSSAVGVTQQTAQEHAAPEAAASTAASSGRTGTAPPGRQKSNDGRSQQQDHHHTDHNLHGVTEEPEHPLGKAGSIGVLLIGDIGRIPGSLVRVFIVITRVIALHLGKSLLEKLFRPCIVIFGRKMRLQVLIEHVLKLGAVKVILNAIASHGIVVVLANGHQQKQSIVALLRADSPRVK